MSLRSGASGSSRGANTIVVDLDFSILELSGIPEGDCCLYQCRWKRGHRQQGETPWLRAEGGRVRWKQSFHLPQQVMPLNGADGKKKFLDIQLHRVPEGGSSGADKLHRNLRVELAYQGEKRRKAKVAVPFETVDGQPIDYDLQIAVQMREATGACDTSSIATSANSAPAASRGRPREAGDGAARRSTSRASAGYMADGDSIPAADQDPDLQNLYAGVQNSTAVSADGMKLNVLKLFSKIQEQESVIVEKRRECKEVRNAYGTLRGDYDQLKAELESAELQCQRLKQELQRERERNRDLVDVRYGSQPYGGDERRSCEAGNCCVQ
eukprot:EG_transcript_12397